MTNTIFVQMASYRDPQLIPTLNDMIANAAHPENLHIGICWQHGDDEPTDIFLDDGFTIEGFDDENSKVAGEVLTITKSGARLSVIDIHFHNTQGACWARNQIQQLYDGEKYTLQLDSHHRFVEGWDTVSIDMLESLRYKSSKPLLTAYIPSFDPENDPGARVNDPWRMTFDRFIPEGAVFFLPETIPNWKELEEPIRARFYSAHFAFADGSFAEDVQHDPEYFFHGEEISGAARAYTHGYDLYHPHRVIAWHEYTRKGRVKVWDDHTTDQRNKGRMELDWVQRNDMCHKRNRILFGMDGEDPNQIDFGKYGFGTERTLRQYEEYSGLSFEYRGVQQQVIDKVDPTEVPLHPYTNDEEWRESFVRSNDHKILLHKSELFEEDDKPCDDYDFWYVAAHTEDETEVFRRDATESEIATYLRGEWVDFRLIYYSNENATKYIIWPHSKSKGWRKRIVKRIDG